MIFFFVFLVLPLLIVSADVILSIKKVFSDVDFYIWRLLLKSIAIAVLVGAFATFAGTILSVLIYKLRIKGINGFKLLLLLPIFVSPYITAVAWRDFFVLLTGNDKIISTFGGVVFVLTLIFTPLAMIITGSALQNIDNSYEEAGLLITSKHRVLLKIILPLIKPALASSFVLIFIFAISEFSVPGFYGVKVFTTEIFTQFSAFYNYNSAILESLLIIAICLVLLIIEGKYLAKSPFLSIAKKNQRFGTNRNTAGKIFVWFWLIISVLVPVFVLIFQAVGNKFYLVEAFEQLRPTISLSLKLAFLGAGISVFSGFLYAYGSQVIKSKLSKYFSAMMLLIFAIPSTVFGISLIKFYNRPVLDFLYSGFAMIIFGYIGKYSFISAKIIENSFRQIPKSMNEAGIMAGISEVKRIAKIYFPVVLPSLIAGFLLVFVFSLGELGVTIMVYPPGTELMPVKVFTIMSNAPQGLTSAMVLIVLAVTLSALLTGFGLYKFVNKCKIL